MIDRPYRLMGVPHDGDDCLLAIGRDPHDARRTVIQRWQTAQIESLDLAYAYFQRWEFLRMKAGRVLGRWVFAGWCGLGQVMLARQFLDGQNVLTNEAIEEGAVDGFA